jgi:uncharacterized protein
MEKHFGRLSRGCELCFEGKKSVLFITGICPRKCPYCPLSEEKKNSDLIHINELKTKSLKEIIKEIKLSNSDGVGITGGDPLAVIDRTSKFIKEIKKQFGKKFHIHLYTSLDLLNKSTISKLQKSGLDELRVHPDIFDKNFWNRIELAKGKFKEYGIEIPVFPEEEKKILELIEFSKNFVDFFNLNELEYATLYEDYYKKKKWKVKKDYSVQESEKTAMRILNKLKNKKIRIHYCSSKFKDSIQFTNRIKVRSKNLAEKFDKITEDGLFLRAEIIPEKNQSVNKLKKELENNFKSEFKIDKKKNRIIFNSDLAKKVSAKFKNVAVVEEYPTIDRLEVEKEQLS